MSLSTWVAVNIQPDKSYYSGGIFKWFVTIVLPDFPIFHIPLLPIYCIWIQVWWLISAFVLSRLDFYFHSFYQASIWTIAFGNFWVSTHISFIILYIAAGYFEQQLRHFYPNLIIIWCVLLEVYLSSSTYYCFALT